MLLDYVNDIYDTLMKTPRAELKELKEELKQAVPPPMHNALEKEENQTAIDRYKRRKEMETPICPPTCTGWQARKTGCGKTQLLIQFFYP